MPCAGSSLVCSVVSVTPSIKMASASTWLSTSHVTRKLPVTSLGGMNLQVIRKSRSGHRHCLWRSPVAVVCSRIAHLYIEFLRLGVTLEQVVQRPLDLVQQLVSLP